MGILMVVDKRARALIGQLIDALRVEQRIVDAVVNDLFIVGEVLESELGRDRLSSGPAISMSTVFLFPLCDTTRTALTWSLCVFSTFLIASKTVCSGAGMRAVKSAFQMSPSCVMFSVSRPACRARCS